MTFEQIRQIVKSAVNDDPLFALSNIQAISEDFREDEGDHNQLQRALKIIHKRRVNTENIEFALLTELVRRGPLV